nr:hypothetical protein [uncultured Methanospirillum sp.]
MAADSQYDEVLAGLQYLFDPGQIIEIRTISGEGISSGYYDDLKKAAVDLLEREKDTRVSGTYVTLNEVNPALLARRANRIKYRLERKDASTADADIVRRRWLPIDIDPVRPSGVSSSDEEHEAASSLAETIRAFLSSCGWPAPLMADSGNGAHLLYQLDLINTNESRDLIRKVLELLDTRFSNTRCKVDTANFNAARIWKVYGTISRKGDDLPTRPHRRSQVLSMPPKERVLSADDLNELVRMYPVQPSEPTKRGKTRTPEAMTAVSEPVLDLAKWLTRYNLTYTAKPYQGGTLYVLDKCPFSDAHTDGAFAIQFESGAIFAGCHHDSCGSGMQRWPELRKRFEPPHRDAERWYAQRRSERIRARNEAEGRTCDDDIQEALEVQNRQNGQAVHDDGDTGDVVIGRITEGITESITESERGKAQEILSNSDPLAYMLETFGRRHEGDQQVAQCLIHSLISRTVVNSKGLHVSISGESGKGKSHTMDTMRSLIPPEFRIEGRMSDKALFYMEDLNPGTVITLDDVSLSDQMQEILKGVTTSFQKPFPYRTVNKDRKPLTCIIPERCVWWLAKVEGVGDDQVFNRMLTCWIDDTDEQDQRVLMRTLEQAGELPGSITGTRDDIRICHRIWEALEEVFVVIPFALRIRFQSAENRRNPDMLLDLIRTHAAIYQFQREKTLINGISCVVATVRDFEKAAELFVALNGKTGGQGTKLTRRESGLIDILSSYGQSEITIAQMQRISGWSSSSVAKLLHGYRSYGKTYSGLLAKCPAISYLDRTVTKGDEGKTTTRRTTVYLWDQDLYKSWLKGGSVWLAAEDDNGNDSHDTTDGDPQSTGEHESRKCDVSEDDQGFSSENASSEYCSSESADPGCSISSINPKDFILIDGFPEQRTCSVCGKRQVQYKERRSAARRRSPHGRRWLCVSCYRHAVSREVASVMALPGVIDPDAFLHRDDGGTCDLCGIRPAVWSDPGDRTRLCTACYEREKQKSGPGKAGGGVV